MEHLEVVLAKKQIYLMLYFLKYLKIIGIYCIWWNAINIFDHLFKLGEIIEML